jgi:glycosyltransferase involved in cell wall biosynthesis
MTTGIILPTTTTHGSGGDFYDHMLINHLRNHDTDLHIYTLPAGLKPPPSLQNEILDDLHRHHCHRLLEDALCYRALTPLNTILRTHTQRPIITALAHTVQSSLEPKTTEPLIRQQERQFYQTIDDGIFVSTHTKTSIEHILGHQIPGIVANPGKDHLPAKTRGQRNTEILRVLYVGSIIDYKGLDTLISALTTMLFTNWELLVVGIPTGSPRYLRRIQTRLTDTGNASKVLFAGYLPHIALPRIYATHDLLVGPSWYEGFGISYVEALGSEMPVIATANGGPSEYLADAADSFLLLPGDVHRLRLLLDLLAASPDHLTTMSLHTKNAYARLPTWRQSLERIHDYLYSHSELEPV